MEHFWNLQQNAIYFHCFYFLSPFVIPISDGDERGYFALKPQEQGFEKFSINSFWQEVMSKVHFLLKIG